MKWKFTYNDRGFDQESIIEQEDFMYALADFLYQVANYNSIDSTVYKKNEVFNTYNGFEPRFGIRYKINEKNSIKASYNRTSQFIHLATNSNASSPFDFWFVSNQNIKPQKADQIALGYFGGKIANETEVVRI